ncbi:Putative uncharacterized protein [Moritella viscosa]|uniref:hypothetical protein n=1 Tax=Moritella viscosa TaxID=80854 RepID=UPI00050928B2|nr:hypothetical protein [Moritella viscosa]CED59532.1 membrane protein [Moritella viscosa]SGY88282.1 Putative uncharacterized protein [Moritella viscosa]SGY88348.1 Putative uncharacterized protein [Moritella viscosa]SHO01102.1 Putative uncharacterized protein [Moritella viscosa]SHO01398.1 Putative uncharacterized protein [Moritella viscosa]
MSDIMGAGPNTSKVRDNEGDELSKHSRFLRKIAWMVEIIVVFIGLCISISLMTSDNNLTSAFTLAAPFVMISLVELTKIPFVIGLWHSRKSFPMYLLIISFLCLITFETLLNGFERAFSSINSQINISEIEISKIENQIKINEENIEIALQDYNLKTQQIDNDTTTVNANYKSKYASEVRRNKRLSKNIPQLSRALAAKKEELIQLKVEKSELLQELSQKKEQRFKSSMERTQGNADLVQAERNRLLAQLNKLNADKIVALDDSNFFTSAAVKKDYDEKIRHVETQLNKINNNTIIVKDNSPDLESVQFLDDYYADLLGLKDDMIQQKNEEVKQLNRSYKNAVSASNSNLAVKQRKLAKDKITALRNLEIKRDQADVQFLNEKDYIKEIKQTNMKLRYDIRVIEIEANTMALSNQVYRMASYIDNVDHYKEVKTETLTLVGLVWFGSLALIGSITGIALTLSGLHLNSLARKRDKKTKVYFDNEA